jgi:NitT/TauT family transport system substrate-binding protein
MIENHPETVQKFVTAYMQGFRWVMSHRKQAAQIVADSSAATKGQQAVYAQQLNQDIANSFTSPVTKAHGLGYMTWQQWQSTVSALRKNKVVTKPPPTSSLFDDSFVRKANAAGG